MADDRSDSSRSPVPGGDGDASDEMLTVHGDDRIADRLFSDPDHPLIGWQESLAQAQRLRADGRFVESEEAISDVIDGLRTATGPAVDDLLGKALGTAAANAVDLGRLDDALRLFDEALRSFEKVGDAEGVGVYSANLATVAALLAKDGLHGELRRRLARAQKLQDDGRLDEAFAEAADVVAELEAGPAADLVAPYGAKAHGLLGMIHYRREEMAAAREHTAAALELGERHGDRTAVVIYTANLDAIDRAINA